MHFRLPILLLALAGTALAQPATPAPASPPPSTILQPALDILQQAAAGVHVERWKASNPVRGEVDSNLASIRRDITVTLPPLTAAADAAPDVSARLLPAYRNVEALYDVLLRVVLAGRAGAPADQASALDQALARLEDARRALGDRLQHQTDAEQKQVNELRAALSAAPATAPPATAPVCPTSPTPRKKARPAAKPAPVSQP